MTNNLLLEKIKEIEKQLKKLPKKEKLFKPDEVLDVLEKTILSLHKNKGYSAVEIVAELKNLNFKISLTKVRNLLKKAVEKCKPIY